MSEISFVIAARKSLIGDKKKNRKFRLNRNRILANVVLTRFPRRTSFYFLRK